MGYLQHNYLPEKKHRIVIFFDLKQGTKKLPKICEKILETKSSWVTGKSPILSFDSYKERVREIDPLVTDEMIPASAHYLHDLGEVCFIL